MPSHVQQFHPTLTNESAVRQFRAIKLIVDVFTRIIASADQAGSLHQIPAPSTSTGRTLTGIVMVTDDAGKCFPVGLYTPWGYIELTATPSERLNPETAHAIQSALMSWGMTSNRQAESGIKSREHNIMEMNGTALPEPMLMRPVIAPPYATAEADWAAMVKSTSRQLARV